MRKLFLLPVVVLAAVGCGDFGDPVTPDTVNPYDVERPDILLLEWEARGAIPAADVNRDGSVDILDLIIVRGAELRAGHCRRRPAGPRRRVRGQADGSLDVVVQADADEHDSGRQVRVV